MDTQVVGSIDNPSSKQPLTVTPVVPGSTRLGSGQLVTQDVKDLKDQVKGLEERYKLTIGNLVAKLAERDQATVLLTDRVSSLEQNNGVLLNMVANVGKAQPTLPGFAVPVRQPDKSVAIKFVAPKVTGPKVLRSKLFQTSLEQLLKVEKKSRYVKIRQVRREKLIGLLQTNGKQTTEQLAAALTLDKATVYSLLVIPYKQGKIECGSSYTATWSTWSLAKK